MTQIVIMPGGFHPFHAGHAALYNSAREAFPDAEVYVAATNDTSSRPFPFAVKEKLAKLAGVESGHFVQVKSPFQAQEITSKFDPAQDQLIFVRSEKDATKPPQAGGVKKDGTPSYLQPFAGQKQLQPFNKHAYMAYLPTVEFGPGMTSATEIRTAWPQLNEKRKTALVMSLYPKTQNNIKLAQNVVKLLDSAIVESDQLNEFLPLAGAIAGRALVGSGASALTRAGAGLAGSAIGSKIEDLIDSDVEESYTYPASAKSVAKQKKAMARPVSTSNLDVKSFVSQGYTIKYYPDRVEIYYGDQLVYKKLGDYSNPTRAQHGLLKSRVTNFVSKKQKEMDENQGWAATYNESDDYIEEKWSAKYKQSINCSNPKGFSQKAHCAGRKK